MFRTGEGVETLSVFLKDAGGLVVKLRYSVYEAEDLITRTAVYTNAGTQPLTLHKATSLSVDFAPDALELITLNGTWAAERTPERAALRCGIQSIGSMRGIPGHAHNPAVALCHADTTETTGSAWGFALVYSGNYLIEAERADAGERLVMGIHPYHFHWTLAPGESFAAPEATMVYSDKGLGEMSRRFHNAIRTRLLPSRWQDMTKPRPVLINSWEACYFDFDEKKLLALAQASKKADIDLFVLDDGWFKGRNDTSSSLGDWAADTRKLPQGLPGLCKKINLLGLDMGLWVEPEAISPDSDLYRAHPDWAFGISGREPLEIRQQYTLDFSRPEVVEGIWQQLDAILQSCPLKYLKWDMNRSLAQVYSAALPAKRQGEVYHRYVLGGVRIAAPPDREIPPLAAGKLCRRRGTVRLRNALLQPPDLVQRQHRCPEPPSHPVWHQPVLPRLCDGRTLLHCAKSLHRPHLHGGSTDGGSTYWYLRL